MKTRRLALNAVSAAIILLACSALAHAQATRTWISGVGDDANPCSRTAPCKTFVGAFTKTATGGEINAIDPGGFGPITINRAITLDVGEIYAGISVSGTSAITVSAGLNDVVILRNININGLGNSPNGIRYLSGRQLVVEHCVIRGFTTGIDVNLTASGALNVRDVEVLQSTPNGGTPASAVGVRVTTTTGTATASIDNLHTSDLNSYGVQAQSNAYVTVSNSRFDRTSPNGTGAALQAENNSNINAESVVITLGQNGVQVASATATIRLSNCDLFSNSVAVNNPGAGTIQSFVNNRFAGNASLGAPVTNVSQK